MSPTKLCVRLGKLIAVVVFLFINVSVNLANLLGLQIELGSDGTWMFI